MHLPTDILPAILPGGKARPAPYHVLDVDTRMSLPLLLPSVRFLYGSKCSEAGEFSLYDETKPRKEEDRMP